MLTAENVQVTIGGKRIVDGVSFTAEAGEWWMLIGPNGAGKSTLLRAVSGALAAEGRVTLAGAEVQRMRPRERACRLGVLAQNSRVNAAFTVEQIVAMGRFSRRGPFGTDEPGLAARVDAAIEQVGLTAQRRQSMLTLSGGEQQRAFLAQVLCQDPQVLLLDEPANHLDLVYQKQLFELVDAWRRKSGRLVVSVVHDLNLARRFGSHALLMNDGRCAAAGPADEVLTDRRLNAVWGMDLRAWRDELYRAWR